MWQSDTMGKDFMSQTGRITGRIIFFIFLGFVLCVWWLLFHGKMYEALFVVNWHRAELKDIRSVAQRNFHLCNLWADENHEKIGTARSQRDRDDLKKIERLASDAWANRVEIECDSSKNWSLVDIRVWIFDEGLTPNARPVYGFWRVPGETSIEGDLSECDEVFTSNWYVCPGKWVFL